MSDERSKPWESDPVKYLRGHLQEIAKYIDDQIPENHYFILLISNYGEGRILQYVANCQRNDALQAMREWIAKNTPERYGKDFLDEGNEGFEAWFKQAVKRADLLTSKSELDVLRRWCCDAYLAGSAEVTK
jgi:hypothetical protein